MTLQVLASGLLTTMQDLGRHGWRHLGVARCGALDPEAAWLANRLVGNPPEAAVLEITLHGPRLRLDGPARIALTGAGIDARFGATALASGRPIDLPAGELRLGAVRAGVRAWLAVAGGFDVPPVLGSRSTDLRGGFGGLEGRALRAGDRLEVGATATPTASGTGRRPSAPGPSPLDAEGPYAGQPPHVPAWWIDLQPGSDERAAPLRYVPSSHPLAPALAGQAWQVDPNSNRQGLRLGGGRLDTAPAAASGISEPVAPGTLQLPPDGGPIVLLADAQTVGGYPRLGHVISADLPRLAQAAPHTRLAFTPCDEDQARAAACLARARMARIELALAGRL